MLGGPTIRRKYQANRGKPSPRRDPHTPPCEVCGSTEHYESQILWERCPVRNPDGLSIRDLLAEEAGKVNRRRVA